MSPNLKNKTKQNKKPKKKQKPAMVLYAYGIDRKSQGNDLRKQKQNDLDLTFIKIDFKK